MRIKHIIPFLFLLTALFSNAQNNNYYYYKGDKVFLTLDKKSLSISVFENFQKSSLNKVGLKNYNLKGDNSLNISSNIKYTKVEFQSNPTDFEYFQKVSTIKNAQNIRTVYPNFIGDNNEKMGLSDYLYVKLKNLNDYSLLQQKAIEKNLIIVEQNQFMPLWYTLRCTHNTIENSLQVANFLFETNLFSSAIPDLLTYNDIVCANDTNFSKLWGLNNSSNPNADINACDAWTITQGNGVNVAVLDQGIELTHDDLASNISSLSYDTESNSSPSKIFGDHGVHCAGTIGAIKDNNLQVVGVAPESTLFSISNSLWGNANSRMKRADGINWAVQNGVDIISNSWVSGVQFDVIDDAIDNALTNGRNGLGTIIVFAAGNGYGAKINYPANYHPDILAIGSITSSGQRSGFSNIGNQLDVVAPGSSILSTGLNNTINTKNGTSMATPHVAGIAALILSVNPNLTVQEVNTIIEETAQKVGDYSYTNTVNKPNGDWNEQMGYGLVNAYQAVLLAQSYNCSDNLSITQNVNSGQTDNQQANYNIEAYNTIFSGGNANYNAGSSVILKPGFHARSEANFRAFIQNCEVSGGTDSFASKKIIKISENSESENEELESIIIDRSSFLNIYPNPSNGLFNIQSSSKIISYTVKNSFGKQIMFEKSNNQKVNIDISRFPVGLYFLSLQIENGELITKKILKK